jgi:2-keto-4-pentenoate hydratase/2-oxohepta-3-ene-1,7-dioic acid hydratase in catechol pathway
MIRSDHAPLYARYRRGLDVVYGRRQDDGWRRLDAAPWAGGRPLDAWDPDAEVELLSPVVPSKVVCVGKNYLEHIKERVAGGSADVPDEPVLFLKPPSSIIGPGNAIRIPPGVGRVDPEAELAVVIGRRISRVGEDEAMAAVWGFTCLNDVSAREQQRKDGQWTRAKGYDTFCPLGPRVVTGIDWRGIPVECRVNGQVRQRASTADMIFPVPRLVSFISRVMTLEPGDVIATGTPAGVAPILPGDVVEVEVGGVGVLRNPVEAAAP